jgi:hypothetical protein
MGKNANVQRRIAVNGLALGLAAAAAVAASARSAAADKAEDAKKTCLSRHEQSQVLRRNNKLTEARATLLACAQDACPGGVRADCVDWLAAVNNAIPSVVVTAKFRDRDENNVRLTVDDELVTSHLDGVALELNPGVHVFRLELVGQDPIEQQLLLVEGQKNRILAVRFGRPEPEASGTATRAIDLYRPVPTLDYVLAGVTLVGVGAFAGFGAWGLSDKKSLEGSCSPVCNSSQLNGLRSKFLVADVSLGVAVVATVVGVYVFFTRPGYERTPATSRSLSRPSADLLVIPTSSGAFLGVEGAL